MNFGPTCWRGDGSVGSFAAACGLAGAQPVGLGAGLEDVGVEGDPVHDGDQARVGEHGAQLKGRFVAIAMDARSSRSVMI